MDGTIVDSMGVWKYAGSTYVRSLGLVPERDLDDKIFHMNMTQFIDYIKKTYSIDTTFDNILADINNQMTRLYATVGQKSGARELLTALKNAGLYTGACNSFRRRYCKACSVPSFNVGAF